MAGEDEPACAAVPLLTMGAVDPASLAAADAGKPFVKPVVELSCCPVPAVILTIFAISPVIVTSLRRERSP